nr:2688_t:CDS:2 [Entrophospora candida]
MSKKYRQMDITIIDGNMGGESDKSDDDGEEESSGGLASEQTFEQIVNEVMAAIRLYLSSIIFIGYEFINLDVFFLASTTSTS